MGRGPSPAGIPHWGILGIRGVCGRLTALSLRAQQGGNCGCKAGCHTVHARVKGCVERRWGEIWGWSVGVEELEKAKRHCSPGDWTPGELLTRTENGDAPLGSWGPTPDRTRAASCEGSRRTDQRRSGSLQPGEVRVKLSDAICEPMRARPAIGGIRP